MTKPKQPYLAAYFKPRSEHGSDVRRGLRKLSRPIDPKRPLHVVMRATQARGERSMLARRHARRVENILHRYAQRFQVRLISYSNVGNHLHLLIQGKARNQIQAFLRVVPGQIAQLITGALKGEKLNKRFWDLLAFSRIVEWGKSLHIVKRYLEKNDIEAARVGLSRAQIDRIFKLMPDH